jgi:hypothetical protein
MRHDRGVQPDQVAVGYWLDPIPPEDMPVLAARMLAEGHDTPALRRAAGLARAVADGGLHRPAQALLGGAECGVELVAVWFAEDEQIDVPTGRWPGCPSCRAAQDP